MVLIVLQGALFGFVGTNVEDVEDAVVEDDVKVVKLAAESHLRSTLPLGGGLIVKTLFPAVVMESPVLAPMLANVRLPVVVDGRGETSVGLPSNFAARSRI